jgi:hypothetical protein
MSDPRTHQDNAIHDQLVDNPIPYKPETETDEIIDKVQQEGNKKTLNNIPDKKPSEMSDTELTKYLGKKKLFRFLVINEDGTYSYEEKRRRSLNTKILEQINEIGMAASNFFNLNREIETDINSLYNRNRYYEIQNRKFFTQNSLIDFYFKSIIFYSFGIPMEKQDKYAIDDDPDEMDNNDAFSLRTIAKVCIDIGNFGWSYFHRDSKSL